MPLAFFQARGKLVQHRARLWPAVDGIQRLDKCVQLLERQSSRFEVAGQLRNFRLHDIDCTAPRHWYRRASARFQMPFVYWFFFTPDKSSKLSCEASACTDMPILSRR